MAQPKIQIDQLLGLLAASGDTTHQEPAKLNFVSSPPINLSTGTLTLDVSMSTTFSITRNANIDGINFQNLSMSGTIIAITLKLISTGSHSVVWPMNVKWPSGLAPTLSNEEGHIDMITLYTDDGGIMFLGFVKGSNLF